MNSTATLAHQRVEIVRGPRSGATIIAAIHSTTLGPALGGCRLRPYEHWQDGLADALRLSEAMTYKTSLAGLDNGGGKMVIVQPPALEPAAREDLLHDAGDLIETLGGEYVTGPDIGTSSLDMAVIGHRTRHVFCRPESEGGTGDSSFDTALGVVEAIRTVTDHLYGSADLTGRRLALVGFGRVGEVIAHLAVASGGEVIVTDIDPARRERAEQLGCRWIDPALALSTPTDILVPAGSGGLLTAAGVSSLRCAAIVGPANNQLASDEVAEALHAAGILWAPDYLVGAGGVVGAGARELDRLPPDQTQDRVRRIGQTLGDILTRSVAQHVPPHRVALHTARRRLAAFGQP